MKTKIFLTIYIVIVMVFYQKARAEDTELGELVLQLGAFVQQIDENQSPLKGSNFEASVFSGGFVGLQAGVTSWMTLETNIQYGQFQYLRRAMGGGILAEKVDRIQVPLLFRFWLNSWFSLAAGPYASYRVGSVNGNNLPVSNSEKTSAHDTGEHGVIGDISFAIPTNLYDIYIVLGYRRIYSLTPRSGESREWDKVVVGFERTLPSL